MDGIHPPRTIFEGKQELFDLRRIGVGSDRLYPSIASIPDFTIDSQNMSGLEYKVSKPNSLNATLNDDLHCQHDVNSSLSPNCG